MTAFYIETLLLLLIAFAIGVGVGLAVHRMRFARQTIVDEVESSPRDTIFVSEVEPIAQPESHSQPATAASVAFSPDPVPAKQAGQAPVLDDGQHPAIPAESEQPEPALADGVTDHRPPILAAPEYDKADDLKLLKGIGPANERKLHELGIFHFRQIAAWTPEQIAWVGGYLAFPGRVEREDWVGQAKALLMQAEKNPPQ